MKKEKRESSNTGNMVVEFIQVKKALWFRVTEKKTSENNEKACGIDVIEPKPKDVIKEGEFITEGFYQVGLPFFIGETARRSSNVSSKSNNFYELGSKSHDVFDLVLFKDPCSTEPQDCIVIGSPLLNDSSNLEIKKLVCSQLCYNSRFRTNVQLIKQVYKNVNKAIELFTSV